MVRNQKTRYDEEHVNTGESAGKPVRPKVIDHDCHHCDSPQNLNVFSHSVTLTAIKFPQANRRAPYIRAQLVFRTSGNRVHVFFVCLGDLDRVTVHANLSLIKPNHSVARFSD